MIKINPKTIVFISLDTVRVDVAYGGKFPNINRLLENGTMFENVVSSSPLTPVSHTTILTGLQPYHHGVRHLFKEKINDDVKTIASILRERGYRTGAVVSSPGLNSWYGFDRGFDAYDDEIPLLPDGSDPLTTVDVQKRGSALKRADLVSKRALDWLSDQNDAPCFQFVHFFDAHWPYEAPAAFDINIANPYEGEVAYMDHYMGEYLSGLTKLGRDQNALIVCFADHGEDLAGWYANDHSGVDLGHPEELGHGSLLFDTTIMVPLIFYLPADLRSKKTVQEQVRLVDVVPTVLDLLGVQVSDLKLDGLSLAGIFDGEKIGHRLGYSETFYPEEQFQTTGMYSSKNLRSVRINNRYKIIWEHEGDKFSYFDLIANPEERE